MIKKHSLAVVFLLFAFTLFVACRENNLKVKIYYNNPGEWPDVGRTVDFIKNGQCEYVKVYSLEELGIKDLKFLTEYKSGKLPNKDVDKKTENSIIDLSMLCAETLFEILDKNGEVVFSYLYFEDEDYFLDTKNDKVYRMTEEIKSLSKKVIARAKSDNEKNN